MQREKKTKNDPLLEIEDLRIRLEEAEQTLSAIRRGEVDGLVVSGPEGDQVYTLKGADRSYRFFVEAMNEGAVTLAPDGTVLYCNDRFAELVSTSHEKIIGHSIHQFIASRVGFQSAFQKGKETKSCTEIFIQRKDNDLVPVSLSFNPMVEDGVPGVCMVVTDLTEHMARDEVLRKSEERLRDLSSKLLTAQEDERKRIAGELHDSVAASIGAVLFNIETLMNRAKQKMDIAAGLEDLTSRVQNINQETRRIMSNLRPSLLDDLGIVPALNWFCREYERVYSHIRVERQIDLPETHVRDPVSTAIYRISQEAMNNVAKHSQATLVNLHLQKAKSAIELTIQDNGNGFDPEAAGRGLGLSTMKERAELSGGTFHLESALGKGTAIHVSWPVT